MIQCNLSLIETPLVVFLPLIQNLVSIEPNIVITDSNKESGSRLTNHYTLSYSVTEIGPLFKSHTPVANVSIDVPFKDVSASGINFTCRTFSFMQLSHLVRLTCTTTEVL